MAEDPLPSEVAEMVVSDPPSRGTWERAVMMRAHNKCSNCGSTAKVRVMMIVPEEAGGQLQLSNGTTLCRACEISSEVAVRANMGGAERPVNFWVSRRLYDKVKSLKGFKSTGSLVRFLMNKFVLDTDRFDDLELWQDAGSEVKINVWVDRQYYETFKEKVTERGLTVTDALKALIRMYEDESEPLMKKVEKKA